MDCGGGGHGGGFGGGGGPVGMPHGPWDNQRHDGPRPGKFFGDEGRYRGKASTALLAVTLLLLATLFVIVSCAA